MRSIKRIKPFLKYIGDEWEKNPDQRFGQLLINLRIIKDNLYDWNTEISDYPIPHEVIRNIQTWETNGKDDKIYRELYIKNLDTDNIKSILKTQKHISDNLKGILKNELKFRKNLK